MRTPLNGTKTHPLSDHAKRVLSWTADKPVPRQEINPGVADRLLREDLVESVQAPSPYAKHRGGNIEHLQATAAGRATLEKP